MFLQQVLDVQELHDRDGKRNVSNKQRAHHYRFFSFVQSASAAPLSEAPSAAGASEACSPVQSPAEAIPAATCAATPQSAKAPRRKGGHGNSNNVDILFSFRSYVRARVAPRAPLACFVPGIARFVLSFPNFSICAFRIPVGQKARLTESVSQRRSLISVPLLGALALINHLEGGSLQGQQAMPAIHSW